MHRHSAQRGLALLIAATALITGALHMLGDGLNVTWSDPIGWLNAASPEEAIAAALRLVGIVTGYWVLGSTLLYILATRAGRRVPAWIRISTLPGVKKLVDRALATALAASLAATPFTPAVASEDIPPPPVAFDITIDGVPVPHIRLQDSPGPGPVDSAPAVTDDTTVPAVAPTLVVQTPVATQPRSSSNPAQALAQVVIATNYTVESGDNLWLIADHHLRSSLEDPTTAEVADYWQEVVAANRATLRSGDPNLIYPGELVLLPGQEVTS